MRGDRNAESLLDIGNDLHVNNGVVTIPLDGFYIFNVILNYTGILPAHNLSSAFFHFTPSPLSNPFVFAVNPNLTAQANGNLIVGGSTQVQLTTGTNLKITTSITGGTKVVNVGVSEFSGIKIA